MRKKFLFAVFLLFFTSGCYMDIENSESEKKEESIIDALQLVTKTTGNHVVKYSTTYKYKKTIKGSDVSEGHWTDRYNNNNGMRSLKIELPKSVSYSIKYSVRAANSVYWRGAKDGEWTDNINIDIKAIKVELEGAPAGYSVKYQVRAVNNNVSRIFSDGEKASITKGLFGKHLKQIKIWINAPGQNKQYYSYPERYYADITGDGNSDLIAINGSHCYVVPWKDGVYDYYSRRYMNAQYFTYPWKSFKDINNDGYVDYIAINGKHCYTVPGLSDGTLNYSARVYMNQIYFDYPSKSIYDYNKDGYLDFIGQSGPHRYIVPGERDCRFNYYKRIYHKLW